MYGTRTYPARTSASAAASDKQVAFLRTLWAERQHAMGETVPTDLSKAKASSLIDALMKAPRRVAPGGIEGPGFFRKGADIIKAQPSRNGGNLYGKILTSAGERGTWEYRPGLLAGLSEADRLTLDEAKAFGRTHGWCIACGALLTDPDSIAAGIGPVCATRF